MPGSRHEPARASAHETAMTAAVALKPQFGPVEAYVEQYAALRRALPGANLPWLASLRDAAIARFQSQGFPTTKSEAWKFTNLARLTAQSFPVPDERPITVAPDRKSTRLNSSH